MEKFLKQIVTKLDLIAQVLNNPWQVIAAMASAIAAVAAWFAVLQVRETEKDRLLPIIVPEEGGNIYPEGKVRFEIRNIGKGIAKDIYVYVKEVLVEGNFNLKINEKRDIHNQEVNKALSKVLKKFSERISVEIKYKDVYERSFKTSKVEFFLQDNIYCLDRGKWKFIGQF